jgi:phage baseplate assembly protein W
MTTTTHIYSDLDLTFLRTPGKGDVSISYDEQAVIRSIKNLLFTNPYERPFQPTIGSDLGTLLFEPASPLTSSLIENEITRVINNYEPRATIDYVKIFTNSDSNNFNASISVFIGNNTQPTTFNVTLKRSR